MFDSQDSGTTAVVTVTDPGGAGPGALGVGLVAGWVRDLAGWDRCVDDVERIEQSRVLEKLKCAATAAQARIAVDFDASQRRAQADAGLSAEELGKGIGGQLALARRESPVRWNRLLGLAKAQILEMPHTLAALKSGMLNEWRATLLVRETACLSVADRRTVDVELAADTGALEGFGDRKLIAAACRISYHGVLRVGWRDHVGGDG